MERDNFYSVFTHFARGHPKCTLGMLVLSLPQYMQRQEQQNFRDSIRNNTAAPVAFRYVQSSALPPVITEYVLETWGGT